MIARFTIGLIAVLAMAIGGCTSKGYVDRSIADVQAKIGAQLDTVRAQSSTNANDIQKLTALTDELSTKIGKTPNQVAGFENYRVIWQGSVNFDFDSERITDVSSEILNGLGQKMSDVPASILEIAGYTDKNGTAKYNFRLGLMRSESVKTYLVDKYGLGLYRMYTISYGMTKPIALPDQAHANAKNRRVELKLWGPIEQSS